MTSCQEAGKSRAVVACAQAPPALASGARSALVDAWRFVARRTGFAVAVTFQTERFYDMFGTLGFVACTAYAVLSAGAWGNLRARVAAVMVLVWALRLGSFLVYRISRDGGVDKRFAQIRINPVRFFVAWTLQALWILTTALPVYAVAAEGEASELAREDFALVALWGAFFIVEAAADFHKLQFTSDPSNKGKFIRSGLWAVSQHPNYAGELGMWWTLAAFCVRGLGGPWIAGECERQGRFENCHESAVVRTPGRVVSHHRCRPKTCVSQ